MKTEKELEEEHVVEQQTISFQGDVLLVALTDHRNCYVSLNDMCVALGLGTRGQQQRIKRAPALLEGFRHLSIETTGGRQPLSCLQVENIELWLASIRTKQASNLLAEKIDLYRRQLPTVVSTTFHQTDMAFQFQQQALLPQNAIPVVVDAVSGDVDQESLQQEMLSILANLPTATLTTHLTTTSSEVDRSLREGILAPEERWEVVEDTSIFSASTDLQVYLGSPQAPLDITEAQEKIAQMGGSAIVTARVVMGLWNVRRHDTRLSINGSAAIRLDEILAWRGFQQHHRAVYPGAESQRLDGYRIEHKQQILKDLELLAACCVRGNCTVTIKGRKETLYVNGPYLRYSIVASKDAWKARDVVGFFISPGDWITAYTTQNADILAEIDRRVFQLNPQNEFHELYLALYLVEQWRQQVSQRRYDTPYRMNDLLAASMIEVDNDHFDRFAQRIESALVNLWQHGIVGEQPACLTPVEKRNTHWKHEWLTSLWRIVPPDTLIDRYAKIESWPKKLLSQKRKKEQRGV